MAMAVRALRMRREAAARARTWQQKKQRLVDGGVFARLTIQEQTPTAEFRFGLWKALGRPDTFDILPSKPQYLGQANGCLQDLMSLTKEEVNLLWDLPQWAAESFVVKRIHGLGWPKASFMLACSGIGYTGCIDSHIVKANFVTIEDLLSSKAREEQASRDWTAKRYQAAVERLWGRGDSAARQWSWWLREARPDVDHDVLIG